MNDTDKAYANAVAALNNARHALYVLAYQLDCEADDLGGREFPKPFAADAMRTRAGIVHGFATVIESATKLLRRHRKEVRQ